MAITMQISNKDSISLKDFCEYVDKTYKFLLCDDLIELAPLFKALGNNRTLLEDLVLTELKDIDKFQHKTPYSSQTLGLYGVQGKFYVRANMWLPKSDFHKINGQGEQQLFAYYQAHDHNFDFMTIGYYGSGYHTDIYEYNHNSVKGLIGEKVDINFLESTTLPEGKIMIYRGSKDIHVQKFPEEFSVSLNIMPPPLLPVRDQFMFDLSSNTISGLIRSNFSGRKMLLEAAGYLGSDNIKDILESIAKNHPCKRTQKVAASALAQHM